MKFKPFNADEVIDAMAPILQLGIDPEFRDGIKENLKVAAKMAILVETVKLSDEAEPAPVYRP